MTDYLDLRLDGQEINAISSLGLAHIGDCVYELMVRSYLVCHGKVTSAGLHRETVKRVSAPAQARAIKRVMDMLSEDELAVYKRGRNARVHSVPKNAAVGEYHAATGLEALFGWLYLRGEHARLGELFAVMTEED